MNRYDIAVFDVDGTLLNTQKGIAEALRKALALCGLREITRDEEPLFIGPPIQESLMHVLNLSPEEAQKTAEVFRNVYKEDAFLLQAHVYDGMMELMDALKDRGVKIAVATYKRQDYALRICRHFGFDRYCSVIYGSDPLNKLKKPDIIKRCLDELKAGDYRRAVMIGDSSFDAAGAQQIGCDFIGVTYGFGFRTQEDVSEYPSSGSAAMPMDILRYF